MPRIILALLTFMINMSAAHSQSRNLSGIVNKYAQVTHIINPCMIRVTNISDFNVGDEVLFMLMKGGTLVTSNDSNFGNISNLRNAGLYELSYIDNIKGDTIELLNQLLRSYDLNTGRLQMISVPYDNHLNVFGTVYAKSWDGSTGGVVVIHALDSVSLNADIIADSAGYHGGVRSSASYYCDRKSYYYDNLNTVEAGYKGESFPILSNAFICGRGAWATGGGGGNNHNTGGGGGGNFGRGGLGGKQAYLPTSPGAGCTQDTINGGIGGKPFIYSSGTNNQRVFMGGGGGGGHQNDDIQSGGGIGGKGGDGGGIVIIIAPKLISPSDATISVNGENVDTIAGRDGAGGGGGGGSVLFLVDQFVGNLFVNAKGGKGGDNQSQNNLTFNLEASHGTGGGGGGGMVGFKTNSKPNNVFLNLDGGAAGIIRNSRSPHFNTTYGAEPGLNGNFVTNIIEPRGSTPCKNTVLEANYDFAVAGKNQTKVVQVKLNDNYNRASSVKIFSQPKHGAVNVLNKDSINYAPNFGFTGYDTLIYSLCPVLLPNTCDTAMAVFLVVDKLIDAVDDNALTYLNNPITMPVTNNDIIYSTASVSVNVQPLNGTVTVNNNLVTYTPNNGFIGLDSFRYVLCGNDVPPTCDSAWVRVNVSPGVASTDDLVSTESGTPIMVKPLANDILAGTPFMVILSGPFNGSQSVFNNDSVLYTPNNNYFGRDSIQYRVCLIANPSVCDTAFIKIEVNPKIRAVRDNYSVIQGTPYLHFPETNDTAQTSTTVSILINPLHGSLSLSNDSVIYTSNNTYFGADSFRYRICSDSYPNVCSENWVVFNVRKALIAVNDFYSLLEDQNIRVFPKENDSFFVNPTITIITPARNGLAQVIPGNDSISYFPQFNYNGLDSFFYQISNGSVFDRAWVYLTIFPVNDPPVATFDTASVPRNGSRTINVLLNDNDPDNDPLSVSLLSNPANGTVVINNNSFVYTPNRNFVGNDNFQYKICDNGNPELCDSAIVYITVLNSARLVIPQGISPNNDNKNDKWVIDGIEQFSDYKITIVNRWGNEVWSTTDYKNDWDGKNNAGEVLPEGTYYYVIRLNIENEEYKGFIVIKNQ